MAHGSTENTHTHTHAQSDEEKSNDKHEEESDSNTYRLHCLKEAVKNQAPDELPIFKREHEPEENVGYDCERSREKNPDEKNTDVGSAHKPMTRKKHSSVH